MLRFISDMHLNETCMYGWRSSDLSLLQYSRLFLNNWNAVVVDEDTTVIAGDLGRCCNDTINILRQLKGRKILVVGNHDIEWGSALFDSNLFQGIYSILSFQNIVVKHVYSELPIELKNKGIYQIHGHHHEYNSSAMQSQYKLYIKDKYRLNCCADLNGMRPRTIPELMMFKAILEDKIALR